MNNDMSKRFPWGKIVAEDVTVGPYTIREYLPLDDDAGISAYHGFIDGKDCHESWSSIDEALAGMIVRRALGANHRHIAAHFIAGINAMGDA